MVLRRDEVRQLVLSSDMPSPIAATYDLRDPSAGTLIMDAMTAAAEPAHEVVRVIGNPVQDAGLLIEITMPTEAPPGRDAGLWSADSAAVGRDFDLHGDASVLCSAGQLLVKPIKGVVSAMKTYAAAPEDARRIIQPRATVRELSEAEHALKSMQTDLTSMLRQRERLASLGSAVAKVSHDLRNILTTAQLFADRIEAPATIPVVARMAPKADELDQPCGEPVRKRRLRSERPRNRPRAGRRQPCAHRRMTWSKANVLPLSDDSRVRGRRRRRD